MNVDSMRVKILEAYVGGEAWQRRIQKMSDGQIVAIYNRLVKEGKIK